jgi:hypothetical protein
MCFTSNNNPASGAIGETTVVMAITRAPAARPIRATSLIYVRNITNINLLFVTYVSLRMYCYLLN